MTRCPIAVALQKGAPKTKTVYALFKQGPHRWIKGDFAQNALGLSILAFRAEAVRFCVTGAIQRVYFDSVEKRGAALKRLISVIGDSVTEWNDDPKRTYRQVLAAVKKARI